MLRLIFFFFINVFLYVGGQFVRGKRKVLWMKLRGKKKTLELERGEDKKRKREERIKIPRTFDESCFFFLTRR